MACRIRLLNFATLFTTFEEQLCCTSSRRQVVPPDSGQGGVAWSCANFTRNAQLGVRNTIHVKESRLLLSPHLLCPHLWLVEPRLGGGAQRIVTSPMDFYWKLPTDFQWHFPTDSLWWFPVCTLLPWKAGRRGPGPALSVRRRRPRGWPRLLCYIILIMLCCTILCCVYM